MVQTNFDREFLRALRITAAADIDPVAAYGRLEVECARERQARRAAERRARTATVCAWIAGTAAALCAAVTLWR